MTKTMIKAVVEADHLSEETRDAYCKRLALIAAAAGNRELRSTLTLYAGPDASRLAPGPEATPQSVHAYLVYNTRPY